MPKLRILRVPDVVAKTGMSISTIYRRIADSSFPDKVYIGKDSMIGWVESEVDEWLEDEIKRSREDGNI